MTVTNLTSLDLDQLRQGFEQWDIEILSELYSDDVQMTQIDKNNPPSAPRLYGKEVALETYRQAKNSDVTAKVENAVANGDRAAATVTCIFPGGRTFVGNVTMETRDGRIVTWYEVDAGDPAS